MTGKRRCAWAIAALLATVALLTACGTKPGTANASALVLVD